MALNEQTTGQQSQNEAPRMGDAPGYGQKQQTRQSDTFSWAGLGSMGVAPMSFNQSAETVRKLKEALLEAYAEVNKQFGLEILELDAEEHLDLTHSVLIVTLKDKANPQFGVVYRPLIIEASGQPFPQKFENINGLNLETTKLISDANTPKLVELVEKAVAAANPQGTDIYGSEATVVPANFPIEDRRAVYRLGLNSIKACSEQLDAQRTGLPTLNFAKALNDTTLQARPEFTQGLLKHTNDVNLPVRSDVKIGLVAVANQGAGAEGRSVEIAKTYGFVQPVWAAQTTGPQNFMAPQGGQVMPGTQVPTQKYVAQYVITDMQTERAQTIEGQLLALLLPMLLREGGMAMNAFRPRNTRKGNDPHDIGAINLEVGLEHIGTPSAGQARGERINTKLDSFTDQYFNQLMQLAFRPGLMISLDVAEAGPDTWFNSVFAAAARGNPRANQAIYEAAMTLTDGKLQQFFPAGQEIVRESARIHMGYFTNKDNEIEDLRSVDYLYVLNETGENDPSIIAKWSDSFDNSLPWRPEQRLAERKKIIDRLVPSVVYTGYGRRVDFTAAFLDAYAKAAVAAGLQLRMQNPFAGQMSAERGNGLFDAAFVGGMGTTGLFNSGYPTVGQNQNTGRSGGLGRWI